MMRKIQLLNYCLKVKVAAGVAGISAVLTRGSGVERERGRGRERESVGLPAPGSVDSSEPLKLPELTDDALAQTRAWMTGQFHCARDYYS